MLFLSSLQLAIYTVFAFESDAHGFKTLPQKQSVFAQPSKYPF